MSIITNMSYKALYRTHRPSTFDEVAGQKHIVQTLKNALKENKIAHAYLFCGPRGTGKTTMARLFAKALNCEEGFGHQCNTCENCISIMEGTHPDVIEIDAASNRGIDDIRDLINKVKYAPIKGGYKVYIIDEVHMLTTEAFNALLKTLEEPPANVVFILATTEPFKLMPTILSRCQRYDFMKVSDEELTKRLKLICEKENVTPSDKAISLIVSLSDGGVRDALSMLDQAIAYSGNVLEEHHVNEIFGLSSKEEKIELLEAVKKGDIVQINSLCDMYTQKGLDTRRLTLDLLDILKDLLIGKTTKDASLFKVIDLQDYKKLTFETTKINQMIDILLSTITQYRFVASSNSLFEIALLKMTSLNAPQQKEQEISSKEIKEVVKEKEVKPSKEDIAPIQEEFKISEFTEIGNVMDIKDEDLMNILVQATKTERANIFNIWQKLNTSAEDERQAKYASILKQCAIRAACKSAIILETQFDSLAKRINYIENQEGFRSIIRKLTGRDYLILCLTANEFTNLKLQYQKLLASSTLPKSKPINLNVKAK